MTTHESDASMSRRAARRGDQQNADVATMLQELAPHLAVDPDPEFRAATRQRLVAMAAVRTPEPVRPSPLRRLLAARSSDAPASRWRTRVTAGLAGAALTVTSLATLVALSTSARPGDVLYGLKRGTEQTQLALAGDSRGQILLDLARTRLDELGDLDGDAALARSTLATMDEQTREGASRLAFHALDTSDPAPLDRLSGWTAEQSAQLGAVRTEVPAPAAADVDGSLALLADIGARADGLRAVLDCATGPDIAGADRLGPVPAGCLPETTAPSAPGGSEGPTGPVPGGPPPETAPAPGAPTTPVPSPPAGPTGQQPAPTPSPAPGPPSAPAPSTPSGGLLPPLLPPLPELLPPLAPAPPATTTAPRPPLLNLGDGQIGLCLPPLLTLGGCRVAP